jgi:hypothetical protein
MSAWASAAVETSPLLGGVEGALVSVSVYSEPSCLEELLDALARLDFPINPQIYHDAVLIYHYPDHHEENEAVTLVEFPAYESHLAEIRNVLESFGFPAGSVHSTAMLDELRSDGVQEPAPAGSDYLYRVRRKRALAVV